MSKFLRRISNRYSRLGKRRKKKLKWKRPTGRDNKMREKRKGYPKTVSIGYRKSKNLRKEKMKNSILIMNARELDNLSKGQGVIVGKVGNKKRIEIIKKADEKGIMIGNFNTKKFLRIVGRKNEPKK